MKLRHAAALALLATLFVGCAVEGSSYEMAAIVPAKSAAYIYRPYNIFGGVLEYPVNCDDHSTSLGPGGYHRLVVDPGHLRCSVHTEVTTAIEFEAKAGENYYIRESLWPGLIRPHVHLDLKSADEAEREIRKCAEQ
jgi:hypothetical protein